MKRIIKLSKFRNIGLEKDETLVLNRSFEKGKMGDLVILIGPNNSGKSNILDALIALGGGAPLTVRDQTTLSLKDEDLKPIVSLEVCEGRDRAVRELSKGGSSISLLTGESSDKDSLFNPKSALDDFKAIGAVFCDPASGLRTMFTDCLSSLSSAKDFDESLYEKILVIFLDAARRNLTTFGNRKAFLDRLFSVPKLHNFTYHIIMKMNIPGWDVSRTDSFTNEKCGVRFVPQIVVYQEKQISSRDITIDPTGVERSEFFKSLFAAIGVDTKEVVRTYEQYRQLGNIASLNKLKKKIAKSIESLNRSFNKMYFAEKDAYKFSVELESGKIAFGMARGKDEDPIMLEYQSTGFRWFFDFYFNFMCANKLNPGDIVVMDEPATNLHPQGQKELRKFIKGFAMKNDLTFVIATHSPFLIDTDNYDELRIVSMENNRSHIDNLFTAVNNNDPDSLLPIKESMTIKQNLLYELETEVVWVEGITDYCYLTMFKNLLGVKNIAFLPFQGVGMDEKQGTDIIARLKAIPFHKRNILVDGDSAGLSFVKKCKGTAFDSVVCISDLSGNDKKFVEIEDLFSEEDKKKYGLYKKSSNACTMKKCCKIEDFTEETVNNFKALFERLED